MDIKRVDSKLPEIGDLHFPLCLIKKTVSNLTFGKSNLEVECYTIPHLKGLNSYILMSLSLQVGRGVALLLHSYSPSQKF